MILAISRLDALSARRVLMSRSRDTEGLSASILATLDWTVDYLKSAHYLVLTELDALFAVLQHRAFRGEL